MNNRPSPNKTRQIGFLVLILVLLLGTIYSMTRSTAKESLIYSEVIELFETKQVESFTIDTDGNLTMQLRSAYKGQTKYSYECGSFSIFYNDLNDLVQEQKAEGILTEYDYPPAWEAAWWLSFVPYLIIFVIMGVLWYSMIRSAQGGGGAGVAWMGENRGDDLIPLRPLSPGLVVGADDGHVGEDALGTAGGVQTEAVHS